MGYNILRYQDFTCSQVLFIRDEFKNRKKNEIEKHYAYCHFKNGYEIQVVFRHKVSIPPDINRFQKIHPSVYKDNEVGFLKEEELVTNCFQLKNGDRIEFFVDGKNFYGFYVATKNRQFLVADLCQNFLLIPPQNVKPNEWSIIDLEELFQITQKKEI